MDSPWKSFWRGFLAQSPFLLGVVPFGLVSGLAAVKLGATPLLSACMSFIVYAGTSQLVAMELFAQGAPALVMLLAVLIVNLRLVIYSGALAPHFRGLGWGIKTLLSYALTDQTFGVTMIEYDRMDAAARKAAAGASGEGSGGPVANPTAPSVPSPESESAVRADPRLKAWFYAGTVAVMWPVWVAASTVGAFVGAKVPESWGLEFAMPLTFTTLVVPTLGRRGAIPAAVVGGVGGVLLANMPLGLGLISASILGILAGVLYEGWRKQHVMQRPGGKPE